MLQVAHQVLQEAGFRGDEEVQEGAVVEGDAPEEEQEVAVRVETRGARRSRRSPGIWTRTLAVGDTRQMTRWDRIQRFSIFLYFKRSWHSACLK